MECYKIREKTLCYHGTDKKKVSMKIIFLEKVLKRNMKNHKIPYKCNYFWLFCNVSKINSQSALIISLHLLSKFMNYNTIA
jgi:recombinational DNA repair protein RecR